MGMPLAEMKLTMAYYYLPNGGEFASAGRVEDVGRGAGCGGGYDAGADDSGFE